MSTRSISTLLLLLVCLGTTGCDERRRGRARTSPRPAASPPVEVQAHRLGQDVRRGAEDAYRLHVPADVRRHVDHAGRAGRQAVDSAKEFLKGLGGR